MAAVLDRPIAIIGHINRWMTSRTIWGQAQNKPSLIVNDLLAFAPADVVYESLLRRGVFKWLAVRRTLIVTKNVWRNRITESIKRQHSMRGQLRALSQFQDHKQLRKEIRKLATKIAEERGYRRGLEQCRAEVRAMCHSDRWQAPDNDRAAQVWLMLRGEAV